MELLKRLWNVDARTIDPLQRIFLVTDGTLTDILEAAVMEPIGLVKLAMETGPLATRDEALEMAGGEMVMERKILLRGEQTGRNYVYAESRLALDRLPEELRAGLTGSDKPMGRLWVESRLESRKEMLEVKRGPMGELGMYFGGANELLRRSYRVISGGRPILRITESFPARYGGGS